MKEIAGWPPDLNQEPSHQLSFASPPYRTIMTSSKRNRTTKIRNSKQMLRRRYFFSGKRVGTSEANSYLQLHRRFVCIAAAAAAGSQYWRCCCRCRCCCCRCRCCCCCCCRKNEIRRFLMERKWRRHISSNEDIPTGESPNFKVVHWALMTPCCRRQSFVIKLGKVIFIGKLI